MEGSSGPGMATGVATPRHAEPGSVGRRNWRADSARRLPLEEAVSLTKLVATFGRHHADAALAGEETWLAESAEGACDVFPRALDSWTVIQTALHAAVVALRGGT